MTTFLFSSFRILKIPPYINFEKFFDRNLAPPSVQRPGTAATPCPLATPLVIIVGVVFVCIVLRSEPVIYSNLDLKFNFFEIELFLHKK